LPPAASRAHARPNRRSRAPRGKAWHFDHDIERFGRAEIVNALAVILTLLVLIVTIRRNIHAQRGLAVQSITSAIAAINVPAMESQAPGTAFAATTRAWSAATREQRILSHHFFFTFFRLCEQAWLQKSGALDAGRRAGRELLGVHGLSRNERSAGRDGRNFDL
jgi:hypothetical protein